MLVAKVGLEPTRSFPPRDFRNTMTFVTSICCLCSGLYLDHIFRFRSAPSSLYTFLISKAWLGISIFKAFTDFEAFYIDSFLSSTQIMFKSPASRQFRHSAVMGLMGFEPMTHALKVRFSSQLKYRPI